MSNLFDDMRNSAVAIVANTMGYGATWQPSTSGAAQQAAQVLYKYSTDGFTVGDNQYIPHNYLIEYNETQFTGLKALVDNGSVKEKVVVAINGTTKTILVYKVEQKFDGATYCAYGDLKTS